MNWEEQKIGSHQIIDMEPHPVIGDCVELKMSSHCFRVEITAIDKDLYYGVVRLIGPIPAIEAVGIHRDGNVIFSRKNIFSLSRKAESNN